MANLEARVRKLEERGVHDQEMAMVLEKLTGEPREEILKRLDLAGIFEAVITILHDGGHVEKIHNEIEESLRRSALSVEGLE